MEYKLNYPKIIIKILLKSLTAQHCNQTRITASKFRLTTIVVDSRG